MSFTESSRIHFHYYNLMASEMEDEVPVDEEDYSNFNFLVAYGSQTGTSEGLAERIAREGVLRGLLPKVVACNDISPEYLKACWIPKEKDDFKQVVFVASTTGQGETPDNMKNFWKSLCRTKLKGGYLDNMDFGVIALGDSSYSCFNFVGKKLFKRVQQLGGKPLSEICLGDDQHDLGYFAAVNPWMSLFWQKVESKILSTGAFHLPSTANDGTGGVPLSKFVINEPTGDLEKYSLETGFQGMQMKFRSMIFNKRVTADDHFQDTRLIRFAKADEGYEELEDMQTQLTMAADSLSNEIGDVLMVQPSNLEANVDKFFALFPHLEDCDPIYIHANPKTPWVKISPETRKICGPMPWSWETIVSNVLDIQSLPRQYFFELMAVFATDELESERLHEFCTPEGQEDLIRYCNRPKRNILEVFEDFPKTTAVIPPQYLFDMIPAIKPRAFSIASPPTSEFLEILVAVVDFKTTMQSRRKGLCSNWLAFEAEVAPIWVAKGSFRFPKPEENAALIMVGPGTGVAPFRSVIQEYPDKWQKMLFFGCRGADKDYYFRDEWEALMSDGNLEFCAAISRNQDGEFQQYVQDKIVEQKDRIIEILTKYKKTYILVAGNAKQMPADVLGAFEKVIEGTPFEERHYMRVLKGLGQYQQETWA